jgi:hypothetical protein
MWINNDIYTFGDFNCFLTYYGKHFNKCQYNFIKNKCQKIVKKMFHLDKVDENEKDFLEKYTGISLENWQAFIDEFNKKTQLEHQNDFREFPMDTNNICTAP